MEKEEFDKIIEVCSSSQEIKSLFKGFLSILEDIKEDHDDTFHKLAKNFPEMLKTLDSCDYLDNNKINRLRKKVLDLGNDAIRKNEKDIQETKIKFSGKY